MAATLTSLQCTSALQAAIAHLSLKTLWLNDTGTSDIMVNNPDWIFNQEELHSIPVDMGNDSKITTIAKGKMIITFTHSQGETTACISNVYLVPKLKKNLIPPQHLIKKGYIRYHDCRAYTLRDPVNNTIFFEATPEAGLIVLNCKVESQGNKGRVHLSYPVSIPSSASQTSPQETWRSSPIKEATLSMPSMQGTAATTH